MRLLAREVGHHSQLAVVDGNDRDAGLSPDPRIGAVRAHDEADPKLGAISEREQRAVCPEMQRRAIGRAVHARHGSLRRAPQRLLQETVLHDDGQFAQTRIVRAEVEARGAVVAVDLHGLHAREPIVRQFRPHAKALEKRNAPGLKA